MLSLSRILPRRAPGAPPERARRATSRTAPPRVARPAPAAASRRARAWPTAALAALALLAAPAPLFGQWPYGLAVLETVHNLPRTAQVPPMSGFIARYPDACAYCHGPHGVRTERPLWNRRLPNGPYRMYDEPLDMIADPQPTGASRLCLSCHDGTVPLDELLNAPTGVTPAPTSHETIETCATDCHNGGNPAGGLNWEGVWFRDDLRGQHPFSLIYDASRDPGFRPAALVEAAGLRLEDGRLQCVTCHEPHSQQHRPFLRLPNTGGSLCLVCHVSPPSETTAHFW